MEGEGAAMRVRNSHAHLRNSGQNPQDIANNILHMANSSYPTNHNVQVPLSDLRGGQYSFQQSRSNHYPGQAAHQQQEIGAQLHGGHMIGDYNHHGQFAYQHSPQRHAGDRGPATTHGQREPTHSVSSTMMSSPHSQHSAHGFSGIP